MCVCVFADVRCCDAIVVICVYACMCVIIFEIQEKFNSVPPYRGRIAAYDKARLALCIDECRRHFPFSEV